MEPARKRLSPVLLLFFLSGATGLIYQVVWVRQFVHVFGATVLAVSTVLAAFMGGLAAGGLFGGRIAGRRARPLATYGVLELVLAAYAGLVPLILRATDPLYSSIYPSLSGSFAALSGVRFLVSVIVLFPPTFLMGATLPLLVEHAARLGDGARRDVARLYATNTFGAVTGTLLASFVLLPSLGLRRTLLFGVGLNLLVALAAIALGRNERRTAHADDEESSEPTLARPIARPVLLGTAAALGFSALAFEVLWTRTLSLAIGTTTYAFAIVLTVFLFGIAAGSALATRLLRDPERAARLFVASPAAIGLLSLALLPLFDRLPDLFLRLSALGRGTFGEGLLVEFLLAALPLLPPTLISGAAFPLAVGIDRARGGASRSVGDIYSANTVGAILGSWIAGFALIPLVGLRTGIAIAAGVLVLATLVLSFQRGARVAGIVTTAVAVAMFALLPQWDRAELTSSGFANRVLAMRTGEAAQQDRSELVFVKEGITTTVSVRSWRGELTMQMNGITEASTTVDLSTQVLVGALPSLLNRSPEDVLVVGLGSGITAAAALRPPSVDHVTCVEISQAVVDGAAFFSETNLGILDDPRCALFVEDARSYLRLSG
ncbi:MAG: fused MFS/spermidine synthase, partial [Gemmatimonadetes bacterium]|nr:fused MFS/spermidine synthase [Gemmatimonadota bacterium]